MNTSDERRQANLERCLKGVHLYFRDYEPATPRADRDYCEFCRSKFSREPGPRVLSVGYATGDGYRWVCESCFVEFANRFEWQVDDADELDPPDDT